jgi:hypothetical protein
MVSIGRLPLARAAPYQKSLFQLVEGPAQLVSKQAPNGPYRNQAGDYHETELLSHRTGEAYCHAKQHSRKNMGRCPGKRR